MDIQDIPYGTSGIYKITFNNNKLYIGLSNDIRRRCNEHLIKDIKDHPELPVNRATMKYGIKEIEILELIDANNRQLLQEREKYWISYYNTFQDDHGYNLTQGGDGSSPGVDNNSSYLSQEQVNSIYNLLLNSNLTYEEIARQIGASYSIISRINNGHHYRRNNLTYPLREQRLNRYGLENKTSAFYGKEDMLNNIILDLKNTRSLLKDLSFKYNISVSLLSQINTGKRYKQENETYPLRKQDLSNKSHKRIFTSEEMEYIKRELQNSVPIQTIAKVLQCDRKVISDINNGKRQKNINWTYPLKNS